MTVSASTSRSDYTGNGSTTAFTGTFRILDQTHIVVYRTVIATGAVTTLALTTDYTVSGVGGTNFTVTMVTAPTSAQRISILRNVPFTQASSYPLADVFSSVTVEANLDKLTMLTQQMNEAAGRAMTLPATITNASGILPTPSSGLGIKWNATGTGLTNTLIDPDTAITTANASAASAAASATTASNAASSASASATAAAASATAANATLSNSLNRTGATGSAIMPWGTTAQRDTPTAGVTFFRYNNQTSAWEGSSNGSAWSGVGGTSGATGAGKDKVFVQNDLYITTSYTLGADGQSAATISVATPGVVTQPNSYVGGEVIFFQTTGALPTGLVANSAYYVSSTGLSSTSFQVSATRGGASIATSGTQSGTHTCGKLVNGLTTGSISLASGQSFTVPTGARQVIV